MAVVSPSVSSCETAKVRQRPGFVAVSRAEVRGSLGYASTRLSGEPSCHLISESPRDKTDRRVTIDGMTFTYLFIVLGCILGTPALHLSLAEGEH
jgi:hypothetical protein